MAFKYAFELDGLGMAPDRRIQFPSGCGLMGDRARRTPRPAAFAWVVAWAMACGARSETSELFEGAKVEGGPVSAVDCSGDLDCDMADACHPARCIEGTCTQLAPVECDDGDPCTRDGCVPETGACDFRPLTADEDGDGFRAPRPGFAAGAPDACGNDCDDTSAAAFPGGVEVCDGVDNDCNGIVDEDARYVPVGTEAVRVSQGAPEADVGGLAFNGEHYGVLYSSHLQSWEPHFKGVAATGETIIDTVAVTGVNSDVFGGPIVWTGAVFGVAWEDRRDGDFEIYFNRLSADGDKLAPDLRVTRAPEFSLRPALLFNGSEFVLAWDDRRRGRGNYQIYGQRISLDGELIGQNVELTPVGLNAEGASIAEGIRTLGLTFNMEGPGGRQVAFRTLAPDLSEAGDVVVLGEENAVASSIVFNGSAYAAFWHTRDVRPGPTIRGAVITEAGQVTVAERDVTEPSEFARSHSVLALGDRLLLVWTQWLGGDEGSYDVYAKLLTSELQSLTPAERVTSALSNVASPIAAFGPDGDVGILYQGLGPDGWQVYFTRLSCSGG